MTAGAFAAVVLTGGASRRMGRDKAFVEIGGRPLAARILTVLRAAGADPVVAVGGDLERLVALGYEAVPDTRPGEGPLGGILTGLAAVAREPDDGRPTFVTACDHPALGSELPRRLLDRSADPGAQADVVVPVVDAVRQPLAALYLPSSGAGLAAAFATGERSVRRALDGLVVEEVLGLPPRWFIDVDTESDLDHYASSDGSS